MNNRETRIVIWTGAFLTAAACIAVCLFAPLWAGVIPLCLGAGWMAISYWERKKRTERLQELNQYLALVCSGQYVLDVAENTEGELSVLQNNLYKVIVLLRTQNERLKKDKIFLSDSLADISHQLKTPLTSMTVMLDLLKEEKEEEKRTEFIGIMEGQQEKMNWLVTNLLKLSKLDAETIVFQRESLSLKELLSQTLTPFMLTMDLKNIELQMEALPGTIYADKAWTIEAFSNIIKNCIEHMADGGLLSICTKREMLYDSVYIRDTGCGIAEEDLPHIFERFYRGRGAGKDSVGIGLALAKAILEKERAEVFVKSEPGAGTEFEIRFYKVIV